MENERVFEFLAGLNRELDDVRSRDLSSGKMIGSAKEREGLYYFDEANVRGQCPPTVCNSASSPRGKWTFVMAIGKITKHFGHLSYKDACRRGDSAIQGEPLLERSFLGQPEGGAILKCIHIVSIKLFKPPRLSLKIRSSLCIPDGRRMGYQGWPMNPNSEEGGYACREHKHKVKPPKEIEGLLAILDLGSWILDSEDPSQIRQLPWHFSIIISL
ncbi:hypothetical protein AAG906_024580 [Vitis piasezkii]